MYRLEITTKGGASVSTVAGTPKAVAKLVAEWLLQDCQEIDVRDYETGELAMLYRRGPWLDEPVIMGVRKELLDDH